MSAEADGLALGIDAGGTATRWHLRDAAGGVSATGNAGPLSGHIFSDAARAAAFERIAEIATEVGRIGRPAAVVAGITGLDGASAEARTFERAIAERLGIGVSQVRVVTDVVIAWHAAFGDPAEAGARGILVYAGTGSVALHLGGDGSETRAGGRGVIIDDGGSGFWIAKEAIKALFRAEDRAPGSGFATPLGRHLAAGFGGADWAQARTFIYGSERGRVAQLAPAVAAAAREGDGVAAGILDDAGAELALLAQRLLGRLGPREVVLAGGASFLDPRIARAFAGALPQGVRVRHERLDAAKAAAGMAAAMRQPTGPRTAR